MRSSLFIPIEKRATPKQADASDFKPLFAKINDQYFILAFDTLPRLQTWAGEEMHLIDYIELEGSALIAGINDGVFLCLNLGEKYYKEFSPDEVKHLRGIVAKIAQLKGQA